MKKTLIITLGLMGLSGCFNSKLDNYVGDWKDARSGAILEITKDGDSFFLMDDIRHKTDFFGKEKRPSLLEKREEQLFANNGITTFPIAIGSNGNTLKVADSAYTRISKDEVVATLTKIQKEQDQKKQNQARCTVIRSEYQAKQDAVAKQHISDMSMLKQTKQSIENEYQTRVKQIPDCNLPFIF